MSNERKLFRKVPSIEEKGHKQGTTGRNRVTLSLCTLVGHIPALIVRSRVTGPRVTQG